jgi:two-component system cell cycle sensor histidine kinase/response regulator CckA
MTSSSETTTGRAESGSGLRPSPAEQSFRIAPALLTTFLIVVALLCAYEFLFSSMLQRFGEAESIFSIGVSALIAVIPTYLALRRQRIMHGRVLSTLMELRLVEAASKESERRFREMLENVELLALIIDRNGIVTFCNNHMLQLTGWQRDEVVGKDLFPIFVPGAYQGRKRAFIQDIEAGTIALHIERQIKTKRGDLLDVAWSNTMLRDGEGKITGTASIGDDVTIRKRTEGRLQLQRSVTAVLADAAPLKETYPKILEKLCTGLHWDMAIIWIVDRGAKVLRCAEVWHPQSTEYRAFADENRSRTFVHGQGLPGRVWAEGKASWHEDIAAVEGFQRRTAIDAGMHGWIGFPVVLPKRDLGVVELFNARAQSPDAEMLATLAGIGMQVGQYIDRQQLEDQFRQAQKMEAIGTLAGGVAHDFNNILTVINGYTELLKLSLADQPEFNEELDAVAKAGARAKDLVKQILTFSRQEQAQRETLRLAPVVDEATKFLRATIPSTIEIRSRVAADVPTVLADPTEVHQIVMNLGTNAWHAMKDRSGRLDVELESFVVDRELAALTPQLREGRYARLSVSDSGKGMDQATLGRIFEPFFTTKVVGEGTGLGLSVVHGIMQSHDGAITVESTLGIGTTFRLYFPAHSSAELIAETQVIAIPKGTGERVLFVDDEAPVANLGKASLERLNYSVETRTDPNEALELIRSEPGRFDLVISDQTMPSMTGIEFARQIKLIRPELPILLTTGYMGQLRIEQLRPLGIGELLPKPLTFRALGEVVHRMLTDKDPHN